MLKFLVFKDKFFSLFGLILKLWCKLMILKHRQSSSGLQLLSFQWYKIFFHLLYFLIHFVFNFVSGLDFLSLLICYFPQFIGFLNFYFLSQLLPLQIQLISFVHVKLIFRKLTFIFGKFKMIIFLWFLNIFLMRLLLID